MEIVGGFMVMMSIIGFFLAVVWLIMPFVVFAIKGKQDRTLEVLEAIEKRLVNLEARIQPVEPERCQTVTPETVQAPLEV
jgi:flagellar biogenesis protein FliO